MNIRLLTSLFFVVLVGFFLVSFTCFFGCKKRTTVALLTDFGLRDSAVGAMKGVILNVDPTINITDITHFIEPFAIKEASFRLYQAMEFYPKGTVFVCVVDPGVGTTRRSIVALLKNGYFFVGPDNGILTHVAEKYGVEHIREIDETVHRLSHFASSFETFHGRDVYAFTGAKIAAGFISFDQVGPKVVDNFVKLSLSIPVKKEGTVKGEVAALDGVYGNVWTNILGTDLDFAKDQKYLVEIYENQTLLYSSKLSFVKSFGQVLKGEALLYVNSLGNVALALNQGNFASQFSIHPGYEVSIKVAS